MNPGPKPSQTEFANHNHHIRPLKAIAFGLLLATTLLIGRWVWGQSAPVLTIAPTGTNQFLISITNGLSSLTYDIYTTPVLGNADYPWSSPVIGTNGQTNFIITMSPYPDGFFMAVVDTNAIPLWEAADPNNPSAGILAVFIDSPTNGATLQ